ncbi:MAG TPA: DUF5615 family PIN-like protein [Gemmataceae bacterium]|nr:DUF5615 family PIN-like protein [Gemmataceae bacterium]
MAHLFADENVPFPLTEALRAFGHDVLTAHEAGRANQAIPDPDVLAHATLLARAVLTNDRRHFHKLHRAFRSHAGIITFTDDPDTPALAQRVHAAVTGVSALAGQLIKIVRPG